MEMIRVHDLYEETILATYSSTVCPQVGSCMIINGDSYRVVTVDHYIEKVDASSTHMFIEVGVMTNI